MKTRYFVVSLVALVLLAVGVNAYAAAHPLMALAAFDPGTVCFAGPGLELVSGFVTAPSTTDTAWTMATGDQLSIKNCPFDKTVRIISAWGDWQSAGYLQIRSPKMHDNVRGLRLEGFAADVVPLTPIGVAQRVWPQDQLTVTQTGSATAGDIESGSFLTLYDELPGVNARFADRAEINRRGQNMFGVDCSLALGTAGGYSGSQAINTNIDLFQANVDYALVGYLNQVECCSIGVKGPDTGNLRVGGPGHPSFKHLTSDWFLRHSDALGIPLCPVINASNKSATLIDGMQDENGADTVVTLLFVQLAPTGR